MSELQSKVANLLIEKHLVKPYEAIDVTFCNARLKEIQENRPLISKNKTDPLIAPTLTTTIDNLGFCVPDMEANNLNTMRIRKLTPKECFRLQGFDDEDFYKAEAVNSNTQLYKQAGNSIVVDVLEAIFTNLKPYLSEREVKK